MMTFKYLTIRAKANLQTLYYRLRYPKQFERASALLFKGACENGAMWPGGTLEDLGMWVVMPGEYAYSVGIPIAGDARLYGEC